MPEPASSFMVGNAPNPASYAAPLMNFSSLANLPDELFQGQQRSRTLALQNAFPNGLPKNDDGSIDINAISDKMTKLGGAEYASQLMPFLIQGQMGQAGSDAITGNSRPPSTSVPGASGPANIRGPGVQQQQQQPPGAPGQPQSSSGAPGQPQLSSAGTDDNGSDTVRTVATEAFGGKDVSSLIPRFAQVLKVDPDAPLTPAQVQQARAMMTRVAQNQPQNQNQTSDATGGGAPVNPVGGTSGNGAPVSSSAPEQPAPGNQPGAGASVPGVPAGYDPSAFANAMLARATTMHAAAARMAAFKGGEAEAQSIENQAKALEDRAHQIFDFMGTSQQPTPEQKNLASGATATAAVIGDSAKSSATKLSGIVGSANEWENDLKPKVDLATAILNDPRIYTGTGGDFSQMLNRAQAVYGPTAPAQLQEMLTKVTASSILAQINGLKSMMAEAGGASSSAGRIFQQQIDLMTKAAPQLGTTLAGNRSLVELERRTGEQASAVRDLALQYIGPTDANGVGTNHKFLDAGFEKVVSNYLQSHPMFNAAELTNPALLGSTTAPPALKTPQDVQAWASGMGLKPGDAVRRNGKYIYYHGPAAPGAAPGQPAQPAPQ